MFYVLFDLSEQSRNIQDAWYSIVAAMNFRMMILIVSETKYLSILVDRNDAIIC